MDGNYRSSLDMRLPQADTVILLDFSPPVCLYRLLKRRIKADRADEIAGCQERINFELLKWVLWTFPRVNRKEIEKKLESSKKQKDIFILRSNKDVDLFLLDKINNK